MDFVVNYPLVVVIGVIAGGLIVGFALWCLYGAFRVNGTPFGDPPKNLDPTSDGWVRGTFDGRGETPSIHTRD